MTAASIVTFVKHHWLLVIALSGLAIFAGLHIVWYIHPSDIKSKADLNARLHNGQPTVIEFYSNL